jgi:hypothetical protein
MTFGLPKSLDVNGRQEPIRWEYTAVLDIISALNDAELENKEKIYVCLYILYENFEEFSKDDYKPAWESAIEFINGDADEDTKSNVKTVDFEQDYKIMIPAINRVAGKEIRGEEGIHWWTFLGWFMEIGECTYSTVLSIRNKKAKGKPLEKWEKEFFDANRKMVLIQPKLTEEEKEAERRLNELLR